MLEKSYRRLAAVAFIVLLIILTAGGAVEDYRSCGRQERPRELFRAQLDDQVQFQTALSAWDDRHDKRVVLLDGRWVSISRPTLREWYAARTHTRADRSQIDCSSFPAGD